MKGICFKEPLFHATIEGRKTQTRRIIKPQPAHIKNGETYERLGVTYRDAYSALIDKINGRGTWDSNPLVCVYDYELLKTE